MPALAQATAVPATVDAATRGEIIDGVIREMSSHYVFPEIATQVQQQLQRRRREKAFEGIDDARAFARRVSAELQAVTHDKHVNLEYSLEPLPPNGGDEPNPEAGAYWRGQIQRRNVGVERVERLAGNVGYLDLCLPSSSGPRTACPAGVLARPSRCTC